MKHKSLGFTLIELMVVVLIIAILGALGLAAYGEASQSARDGKRKADIEAVRQALLLYRQEHTSYPSGTFNQVTNALVAAEYLSAPAPREAQVGHAAYSLDTSAAPFCICATMENNRGNHNNNTCDGTWSANSGAFYCARP